LDTGRLQLAEPVESLQARFRRVEVVLNAPRTSDLDSGGAGATDWLNYERSGHLVRFVETRFSQGREGLYRERFPDANVTATPLSLREIFVALALQQRATATPKA
jgi:ABC-2 type transport system ATP-binding protein